MLRARNLGTANTGAARRPSRQCDYTGARDQHQQALDITLATRGTDHPDTAPLRGNLGAVLHSLGDQAGARDHLAGALEISVATLGAEHPQTAWIRRLLDESAGSPRDWAVPTVVDKRHG